MNNNPFRESPMKGYGSEITIPITNVENLFGENFEKMLKRFKHSSKYKSKKKV